MGALIDFLRTLGNGWDRFEHERRRDSFNTRFHALQVPRDDFDFMLMTRSLTKYFDFELTVFIVEWSTP